MKKTYFELHNKRDNIKHYPMRITQCILLAYLVALVSLIGLSTTAGKKWENGENRNNTINIGKYGLVNRSDIYMDMVKNRYVQTFYRFSPFGIMHFVNNEDKFKNQDFDTDTIVDFFETQNENEWMNWRTYISLSSIMIYRWGIFIIFKWFPSLCYRQKGVLIKKRSQMPDKDIPKRCCGCCNKKLVEEEDYYSNEDVTVVISVHNPPKMFVDTLTSILSHKPKRVIVVSSLHKFDKVREKCAKFPEVELYIGEKMGKRDKLAQGIGMVKTRLVALTDDDVGWLSPKFLLKLVAPFADKRVGGVGCKHMARIKNFCDIQSIMAQMRLEARSLELRATTWWDGGTSCISGRTACYRTAVFHRDYPEFKKYLTEEIYCPCCCKIPLLSGDDKCITRYIVNSGYKTYHQLHDSCILDTTFESGSAFLKQLLRWARNTWRSDTTFVFLECKVWCITPVTAFLLVDKMATPGFMIYGITYYTYRLAMIGRYELIGAWLAWLVFSRFLKLIHYLCSVKNCKYTLCTPCFTVFQYLQMLIKIYALMTVHVVKWGTKNMTINKAGQVVENDDVLKSVNYDDDVSDEKKEEKLIELPVFDKSGKAINYNLYCLVKDRKRDVKESEFEKEVKKRQINLDDHVVDISGKPK